MTSGADPAQRYAQQGQPDQYGGCRTQKLAHDDDEIDHGVARRIST